MGARAGCAGALLALTGCGGPLSTLAPMGRSADAIALVWWWMLGISVVVLTGVLVLWLLAMRSRRDHTPQQAQRAARWWLIGGGVLLPGAAILALMFFGAPAGTHQLPLARSAGEGPQALEVRVTGNRFWWEMHYTEAGVRLRNELRLPVGRAVDVHVTSADVIHSFWIPRLAGKLDALPGRVQVLRLHPEQAGRFLGQCAEYCGVEHPFMKFEVYAMEPQAFDEWLAQRRGAAMQEPAR
ncbi:cytochrome c oxidase subunit II [Ramlibacter sp. AN1015]|uniref:cytochrome c oxidase subunit II n=1 Tax=Ramlibacter sp. AN1015 TaxID=3133428 RepID=UPI0030BAFFEF